MGEVAQHAHASGFWTPPQVRAAILEYALKLREQEACEQARGDVPDQDETAG